MYGRRIDICNLKHPVSAIVAAEQLAIMRNIDTLIFISSEQRKEFKRLYDSLTAAKPA